MKLVYGACLLTLFTLLHESTVWANGLVEMGAGLTIPTGSDLNHQFNYGGRAIVGWGGRLSTMAEGSAVYGYGSLDFDQLTQIGPNSLGKPTLNRTQWTPTLGVRMYRLLRKKWRIWCDLGLGKTYDRSSVQLSFLNTDTSYRGESNILNLVAGLQYKWSAGLLLSLAYTQSFYFSPKQIGLSERALQIGRQDTLSGRGKLLVSWGFYL